MQFDYDYNHLYGIFASRYQFVILIIFRISISLRIIACGAAMSTDN